jgi:hypothetical protein
VTSVAMLGTTLAWMTTSPVIADSWHPFERVCPEVVADALISVLRW